ncbi:MAG: O-antigen ligase family protein, partial [bacterium]
MKYYVFSFALLGVVPLAFLLFLNSKWMRFALWGMALAMFAWQGTAINFLSHEEYRGSARGMEVSLLYLLAFALLLALMLRGKVRKAVPDGGFWTYVIYFLLCLPSFSAAESAELAWCEIWKMIMLYTVCLTLFWYLRATGDVQSLLLLLAVIVIGNFLSVAKGHYSGIFQPRGIFPHRNCMAMAMNLLGPIFFASYMMNGVRKGTGVVFAVAGACAGIAALWSYSRGAIAVVPVGYGLAALACFWERRRTHAKVIRLLPLALASVIGIVVMLPRLVDRFENATPASANTRVELALCAVEMMKEEPLRGVGINNWGIKINAPYPYAKRAGRFFPENMGSDGVVETVYLLVGAECGIPALIAMLVWFGWYWLLAVRLLRR